MLVGETWLAVGEKNVDTAARIWNTFDLDLELDSDPKIPAVTLVRLHSPFVKRPTAGWQQLGPTRDDRFNEQLTWFAIRLVQTLEVPVGVLLVSDNETATAEWASQ